MQWPKTLLEWMGWTVGGIVLAVLGNAVWEYIVRPAFAALFRGVGKWARHRTGRMFDRLFETAAGRPREMFARLLIVALLVSLGAASGGATTRLRITLSDQPRPHAAALEEAKKLPPAEAASKLETLAEELETELRDAEKKAAITEAAGLYLALIFMAVASLRALIIDLITRIFERRLAIVRPRITNEESLELLKGFAEMKSYNDFRALLGRMKDTEPAEKTAA